MPWWFGATESDPLYLWPIASFCSIHADQCRHQSREEQTQPGRSRSIFELFPTDEDVFESAQLWKNLLEDTCTVLLWKACATHPRQVWAINDLRSRIR